MRLVKFQTTRGNGEMLLETVHLNPEHVAAVYSHPYVGSLSKYRHTTIRMREGTTYEVSNDAEAVTQALMCEDVYECEPAAKWGEQHA